MSLKGCDSEERLKGSDCIVGRDGLCDGRVYSACLHALESNFKKRSNWLGRLGIIINELSAEDFGQSHRSWQILETGRSN